MSVESATKIQDLNPANPLDSDPAYQGAAHLRMIKECLKNPASAFTPAGAIIAFAGVAAPAGWLLCNGATLLKADYPDLADVLGTIYGAGDTTHFVLPDLRGYFIRGLNSSGSGKDKNRVLGSSQVSGNKSHSHTTTPHTHTVKLGPSSGTPGMTYYPLETNNPTSSNTAATDNATVTVNLSTANATGDDESRPENIAMNYIIKY